MKPIRTEVVFRTPWCELVAKTVEPGEEPWYSVRGPDYTAVVALTPDRRVVAVRQFRPAVERDTIELPSGNLDPGETPEATARRELLEETGYQAGEMQSLGVMLADAGRLGTRVWFFLAEDVRLADGWQPEPGLEVLTYSLPELSAAIATGEFDHSQHVAALVPALLRGKLRL